MNVILMIQKILTEHNLGNIPNIPFSNEVAANLLKRIKNRIPDLEKDLQDKKKSNEMELKFLWEQYVKANTKCSEIEADKQSKIRVKAGIIKRIEAKENERDIAERELDSFNLHRIDKKEEELKVELDQKTNALSSRDFESIITCKKTEVHSLEQQIISPRQDRNLTASEVEELESYLKKMKKVPRVLQKKTGAMKTLTIYRNYIQFEASAWQTVVQMSCRKSRQQSAVEKKSVKEKLSSVSG